MWTVHATCPRDTSENKPIRKRNHDMSLRQDPPCEHFNKPIPATCPFVWTAHEILPRDMSLQHVPSCEPTFTARVASFALELCNRTITAAWWIWRTSGSPLPASVAAHFVEPHLTKETFDFWLSYDRKQNKTFKSPGGNESLCTG